MKIKSEEQLLFICTRQNFLDEHRQAVLDICREHQVNWPAILDIANLHGVAPLIYANLRQCPTRDLGIPSGILNQFRLCLMQNMPSKERMAKNISRAITFFSEKAIDVMLIKGAALDVLVYEQPYYTVLHDADIVINVRKEDVTDAQCKTFMSYFHRCGVEYDYYEHHDVIMNGVLPVDFQSIWNEATKIEFRGQDIFVMSPEDMLISVCINSCRKRFFRLKALCDIAEIVDKYPPLNWSTLVEKARAYDCHNIVYTALFVTKLSLGCNLPDQVLENLKVNPLRAGIIRYLSRHMSTSAYSSLYSGRNVLGRTIDLSLLLPYSTFRHYQLWRRIRFAGLYTREGMPRAEIKT